MNPLNVLYTAVAWVLRQIYGVLSPIFGASSGWTWALSIVILVVLMRLIMVPLFIKQMHTTRKMSALAPQVQALKKKYKNDKQTLNQETMKLYQTAGVNPLMGCLPVAAQLPVWFALFSVLRSVAEWHGGATKYGLPEHMVASAQHAKIFGASIADKVLFTHGMNVPMEAKVVIVVTVVISMVTTFLTVRQSQKRGMMPTAGADNPMAQSQKYMAYVMPFFALSGLYWPFGLVLYWVTTNVWTLCQQVVLLRIYPQPVVPGAPGAGDTAAVNGKPPAGPGLKRGAKPDLRAGFKSASKPAGPGRARRGGGSAAAGAASVAAQPSANGGGILRKLVRGREDPAAAAAQAEPEAKIVRQQRQKQSRSKRSGKR